jgi:hypothetical protein
MPLNSRNKGAGFEREIANKLNDFFVDIGVDYKTKRNLNQYQEKDQCDLDLPFHAVECKFYKEGNWIRPGWWEQVCSSSNGKIPTLVFKFNRRPIRVCIPLYAFNTEYEHDNTKMCVIPFDDWLYTLKENWHIYENEFGSSE